MWQTHVISEAILKKSLTPEANPELTVSGFLRDHLAISTRNRQKLFRNHQVRVNHRPAHSQKILKLNDVVKINVLQDKPTLSADFTNIEVLYEDDFSLVVNKPPFLLIHPTEYTKTNTLSHRIAGYYQKSKQNLAVRPINRLDRDTSGCVLIAKTKEAQTYYSKALADNKITRTYLAVIQGQLSPDELDALEKLDTTHYIINLPIGKDPKHPNRRQVSSQGKVAKTIITPLEYQSDTDTTLIEATIPTGRTHQIRVHLAHLGHPVVGDTMYGSQKNPYTRQCLHASKLTFTPYKKEVPQTIEAPLPKKFGQEKI